TSGGGTFDDTDRVARGTTASDHQGRTASERAKVDDSRRAHGRAWSSRSAVVVGAGLALALATSTQALGRLRVRTFSPSPRIDHRRVGTPEVSLHAITLVRIPEACATKSLHRDSVQGLDTRES